MSSAFKGMMTAIIALSAAAAFLLGIVIPVGGRAKNNGNENVVADSGVSGDADNGGDDTAAAEEGTLKDSAGNEFTFPLDASSVIALNDNAADMLSALGKESLVTGISDGTKYPASVLSVTRYGTEENPHTENIIAAAPGAVIVSVNFKDSEDYKKISDAGIKVVCLNLDDTDTAVEEVAKLGLLFDACDKADEFITDIENVKSLVGDKAAGNSGAKIYWEKSEEYTSVGKDGNENKLMKAASAVSVTADKSEKEVKTDAAFVKGSNPDVIVKESGYDENILTLENDDIKKAEELVEGIEKRSGLEEVNAVKNKKVIALSERITNTPLGSAMAPLYVAKMAYPDAFSDVTPGNYLNEFLNKYWGGTDYKGVLAYAGNLSADQNASDNVLASGSTPVSGGSLISLAKTYGSSTAANTGTASLLSKAGATSSTPSSGNTNTSTRTNTNAKTSASTPAGSKNNLLSKAGATSKSNNNTGTIAKANSGDKNNNTSNSNKSNNANNKNNQKSSNNKQNDVSTSDKKEVIKDSTGQDIVVNKEDGETGIEKCIVFNSSIYEMIKVLGCQDTVVGVAESLATSADFPELHGMSTYGTWKEPNAELIIEANPDVVFAYANYGQEALEKIRAAGITVISLNFYIPSEIEEEIIFLGKTLGNESRAREYVKDVNEIQNEVARRTRTVSKLKCYWEGYTDYTSVADGSGGNEIIALANLYNVYTTSAGGTYPEISSEWIIHEADPQVIVKMVSGTKNIMGKTIYDYGAASAKYNELISRPGWSEISAVKKNKVIILNSTVGTTALGCAVAPLMLAKVAYPERFADIDVDAYTKNFYKKYWGTDLTGTWRYTLQKLN